MPNTSSSPQGPPIRTFQLDTDAMGNLPASVNLFRGDVNLTQTLFTLPGRSQDKDMDVNLSIQYQSNVYQQATTWNRDRPTGVLGLGWQLPLTYIQATDNGSPVSATRSYTLFDNGSANGLTRQSQQTLLLRMDPSQAAGLEDGASVPLDIVESFSANGLVLDASARVAGTGPWALDDAVNQQEFDLILNGDWLEAYDGGESYQLQNYQFSKIVYYPTYERWVITRDNAVRQSFGGTNDPAAEGMPRTANGNSILWQVWWQDSLGRPAWRGSSSLTEGQVQIAGAWYLNQTMDRFGETVSHTYSVVEQQVGEGGLPFGKAIYLASATDVFGRTVRFTYQEKQWREEPSEPREYTDPYRTKPSNDPSPYQAGYENLFLDSLVVSDTQDATMFSMHFTYELANVTATQDALYGDTYKRYLREITLYNQDDVAQPSMAFDYYLVEETGSSPGALAAITFPEGGKAVYSYSYQELDICQRTLQADRPTGVPQGATPRVFFGPDYAVVCFYNQSSLELSLQVYTWAGSWLCWQLTDDALIDTRGLELDSLDLLADQDFLALHFVRVSPNEQVLYVLQKDISKPGQWLPATIDGSTTAADTPNLVYETSGRQLTFAGGSSFFTVASMDTGLLEGTIDRLTFRWTTRAWTREQLDAATYSYVTASGEYYAVLDINGDLSITYLDGTLVWQDGGSATLSDLNSTDLNSIALVPGQAMVAVSNLQAGTSQQNIYRIWLASWNDHYQLSVHAFEPFTDTFGTNNSPTGWLPQLIDDTLVGINGNLLRFNAKTWEQNTSLNPANPDAGTQQRYAFGPDYALQIIAPTTGVGSGTGRVLAFDPTVDGEGWARDPVEIAQALPAQTEPQYNWPSSGGGDYAVMGPYLYFRGSSDNWENVVSQDATANLDNLVGNDYQLDSESMVNEAPHFLGYTVDGPNSTHEVQAIILKNGGVEGSPLAFGDQKMVSPGENRTTGAGVSPKGPELFVTYPAEAVSFDDAQSIFLNQYTTDAVTGPITHYTVTLLEMEDGYGDPVPNSYRPDTTNAGCDATGEVVKFFQATLYPGSEDPDNPSHGYTVFKYLNGLVDQSGENFYDMLDGLQIQSQTYDNQGTLKQGSGNTYRVFQQVAASAASDAEALPLRGGYVAQVQQDNFQDGVSSTQTTQYIAADMPGPFNGLPIEQVTINYDGAGKEQSFTSRYSYGAQFVEGLRAINAVRDKGQRQLIQSDADQTLTIQSSAVTYASWKNALGVYPWSSEASFGLLNPSDDNFPYSEYQPGDSPSGWVLASRTTRRGPYGPEQESVDALKIYTATLYATDQRFAVARTSNAADKGFAYLGFQSYEDTSAWTMNEVAYDENDARTGTRSALLAADANASMTVTVIPRPGQTYLMGCWYQTGTGYVPEQDAGWHLVVSMAGSEQNAASHRFSDTGGQWAFQSMPIEVPQGDDLKLQLTVTNPTGQDLHLDTLFLVPLANNMVARTFNEASQQVTSTLDAAGRTSFTYYDRNYQPTISVGPSGQVREISQRFLSRQGNRESVFDPDSPNAQSTLRPAAGGFLESFRDGSAWQARWSASNRSSNWREGDGVLEHTSTEADRLAWQGAMPAGSYGIYLEISTDGIPDLTVNAGDISLGIQDGSYFGVQGTTTLEPLADPPPPACHWLMVVGEGVVLFFADGQLLFSFKSVPSGDDIFIETGGEPVTFRRLSLVENIRLGTYYNDAAARVRQVQQLHGDDSQIIMVVNDALSRRVATTRVAPGSFGSGADLAVLQYSPGFLDVSAFLDSMRSDWQMRGDIAEYYRGQSEGGITRSDDGGYPYRGWRYEDSPRQQIVEQSLPGAQYAINLTLPQAERQTTLLEYQANTDQDGLPADQYQQNTQTSPVKTRSVGAVDKVNQQVATWFYDENGEQVSATKGLRAYDQTEDGPLTTLATQLPNATMDGPQSENDLYVQIASNDALQRPVFVQDPDAGETRFIADDRGRLRFVQPALDTGETWFIYYKYDPIGRMVEEGTVEGEWDRETLQPLANDETYPSEDNSVAIRFAYDGDGWDATLIGKKHQALSYNPDPEGNGVDTAVTETFAYDRNGRISAVTMWLEGSIDIKGTIAYAYNSLSEVVRVDYPQGAPLASVYYGLDDLGKVVTVGTAEGENDLASFTYSADNVLETQILAGGAWRQITNRNSPGWITTMTTTGSDSESLELSYTYAADGLVTARQFNHTLSGTASSFDQSYQYDGQRRFYAAAGDSPETVTSYDPSGNIWALDQNGSDQSFQLRPGSNRLQRIDLDGEQSEVSYNARGEMTAGNGRTFTYDRVNAVTTSITAPDGSIALAYGSRQQRVLKRVLSGEGGDVAYFFGPARQPLARHQDGAWQVLIQGPAGLLALWDDVALFPLSDNIGSIWAVVDANGPRASFTYAPYGQTLEAEGDFPYLFQGQEWDREVGLYNFKARMYDPVLRRFLTPDPARQFASLYLFAGNNPLGATDPSGEISVWAQVGIGAAMVAITAVGIGLTLFTCGASDEAAAAADAALITAEVGMEAGSAAAAESAAATATEETALLGAETGTVGNYGTFSSSIASAEVTSGASAGEAGTESSAQATAFSATKLANFATNVAGSTLQGAGLSGLQYDLQHGQDFTTQGFFEAVGIGAASGFAAGVVGGSLSMARSGMTGNMGLAARIGSRALIDAVSGAVGSDVSTVLTNVAEHQPWYSGLAKSTVKGAVKGGVTGAISGTWMERNSIRNFGTVSEANTQPNRTSVVEVQQSASNNDQQLTLGNAAFFMTLNYTVFGLGQLKG